jgi:putative ABC transport system substrate-binding protein
MLAVPPNNSMNPTALRAAGYAERSAHIDEKARLWSSAAGEVVYGTGVSKHVRHVLRALMRSKCSRPIGHFHLLALALLLSFVAAALAVDAQQSQKVYRIGMLERTSKTLNAASLSGFLQGMRELGYVEGKHFVIEYRSADGLDERFLELAADLARLKVDLIVTRGTQAILATKNATDTIPIVITGAGDPVAQGIVASLARPGANITGLNPMVTELYPKRVEVLRALVPKAVRIAALCNMSSPAVPPAWKEVESAARSMGIEARLLDVRKAGDLGPAFEEALKQRADGLVVALDTLTQANRQLIVELAGKHRLPAVYASREFSGGLVTYGVNYGDVYRRAAAFVDKIFKGAKPADLPMQQPTQFELVINLKTAGALGLTVPPSLLLQADQLIQ